jgi:hypothetical protein
MMTCRKVREWLSQYLEGDLDRRAQGEVEAHLEGCASCRSERERFQRVVALLEELPPPASSGLSLGEFRAALAARQAARQRQTRLAWWWGLAVAATASLGATLGLAVVVSGPHAAASFSVINATTTVEVPPDGNPSYVQGDYLTQQSDHTITVKKVNTDPPFTFYWRGRNSNTCNGASAEVGSGPLGMDWPVGQEESFSHYDLTAKGQLPLTGGFAVNSYTEFKRDQAFEIKANDSNAFMVRRIKP